MEAAIIVINAGSSSIKFKLFYKNNLEVLCFGQITGIGTSEINKVIKDANTKILKEEQINNTSSRDDLLIDLLNELAVLFPKVKVVIAGHRVVHGGNKYLTPTIITDEVITYLKSIISLTPIHLPHNIRPMEILKDNFKGLTQVACFDTSFHVKTNPLHTRYYALPKDVIEKDNIMRYGFHGISYEYIALQLSQIDKDLYNGKVVICHLGAGASLCALVEGKSFTTTMGFTPLDGLIMGSRTGSIDPGLLLFLLKEKGYSVQELEDLLYYKSGVLGLSGISSDFYTLAKSSDKNAQTALLVFQYNVAKHIGSLIVAMGGIDGIVFTAGVGENDAGVREYVAKSLKFLGAEIDLQANQNNAEIVSTPDSKIKIRIIPTQEEFMIAQHSLKLIN